MLTGKKWHAIMEIRAAVKFVKRYKIIIIRNLDPSPDFACEIAEATKTKTRMGAIALRADTKMSPIKPMSSHCGTKMP